MRYRFNKSTYDRGLFVGATFGYEGWTAEEETTAATDAFANWYSSLQVGYNWYPLAGKRLHVGANYNLIFLLNSTDDRRAGQTDYRLNEVVPPGVLPSLFVGWRLGKAR